MATNSERFTSAADAYDHHVGRYGVQLAAGLVEVADIRPGQRVLDVGCGPGPLTRALADRAGEGNVSALDPSPEFVDTCRARMPGADVRVGVAEQLPFSSNTFDDALAQLVVQLMDDRDAGVAEMIRVTRPAVSSRHASGTRRPCHCCAPSGTQRWPSPPSARARSTMDDAWATRAPTSSGSCGNRADW